MVDGPALIFDPTSTIVVEPGWRAERASDGTLVLTRAVPLDRAKAIGTDVDPVRLEIFNNLFMAIAEEMGVALQSTATSVNIKERLDFSCAMFDADGRADRQRAAHPGASGLDGREHPHDHRHAGRGQGRARDPARRRLCAQRPLSRRHASARHHRDRAGVLRRRGRARRPSSPRAATMPTSAGSRRDRCRPTAARSTRKAC